MVHDLSDRSEVVFDDERVVVNAGLVLAVTLGRRLGLEQLVGAAVRLGSRPGASRPGRKVLSLVHAGDTRGSGTGGGSTGSRGRAYGVRLRT